MYDAKILSNQKLSSNHYNSCKVIFNYFKTNQIGINQLWLNFKIANAAKTCIYWVLMIVL